MRKITVGLLIGCFAISLVACAEHEPQKETKEQVTNESQNTSDYEDNSEQNSATAESETVKTTIERLPELEKASTVAYQIYDVILHLNMSMTYEDVKSAFANSKYKFELTEGWLGDYPFIQYVETTDGLSVRLDWADANEHMESGVYLSGLKVCDNPKNETIFFSDCLSKELINDMTFDEMCEFLDSHNYVKTPHVILQRESLKRAYVPIAADTAEEKEMPYSKSHYVTDGKKSISIFTAAPITNEISVSGSVGDLCGYNKYFDVGDGTLKWGAFDYTSLQYVSCVSTTIYYNPDGTVSSEYSYPLEDTLSEIYTIVLK
jgi:hypothetical protein